MPILAIGLGVFSIVLDRMVGMEHASYTEVLQIDDILEFLDYIANIYDQDPDFDISKHFCEIQDRARTLLAPTKRRR